LCSTRWQGTAKANQLREQELATARIARGLPIASAILEYVEVSPNGILRTSLQIRFCSSVPRMSRGNEKGRNGPAM
jgi:hypothetical protein